MNTLRKIAAILNKVCDFVEKIANIFSIFFLTAQTVLICILVVGRYIFKAVPKGTEELALLCMVWLAMMSMILSIRDDSHLKMELVDIFVSADKIKYFQVFAGIATVTLSVFMIKFGIPLWKLRWGTKMATIKLSNAWYYGVLPLAGLMMGITGAAFTLNSIIGIIDERANSSINGGKKISYKEAMALVEANEAVKENMEGE